MTSWTLALLLSRRRWLSDEHAPLPMLETAARIGWCSQSGRLFHAAPLVDQVASCVRVALKAVV